MKKLIAFLVLSIAALGQNITAKSINKTQYVSQFLTAGVSVGQAIDNACSALAGNPGVVVIEGFVGTGTSLAGTPWNCAVVDWRNTSETGGSGNYLSGLELFRTENRDASAITTIRQMLTLRYDDQDGGVNNIALPNKTQSQNLAFIYNAFDVGEHHGFANGQVNCAGSGDCLTYMAYIVGMGGYGTGGDEGQEGTRIWNNVGDGTATGGVPVASGVAVASNVVTGTWTNVNRLGVRNAVLIVTNRGTYNTGTIASAALSGVCHLTGTATGWTALGVGAHSDRYIRLTEFESASAKFVVQVTAVNSDTDISINYSVNEIGPACPVVTAGSSYTIYLGQLPTHVAKITPASSSLAVTVANAGTILAGDTVEQPVDYNVSMYGHFVTQYSPFTLGGIHSGVGFYTQNIGPGMLESGMRINGNTGGYGIGLRLMNNVVVGIQGAEQMVTFMRTSDTRAGTLHLFNVLNTAAASFNADWDRTNGWWHIGGFYMDGATTRISTNSTPQPLTQFFLGYGTAGYGGLRIAPANGGANGLPFSVQDSGGIAIFEIPSGAGQNIVVNNSHGLIGYLNDHSAPKWSITTGGVITGEGFTTSGNAQLANIIATGSVYPDGAGLKHQRTVACTTGAGANAVCSTTVTWGTPFVDANYTATCTLANPSVGGASVTHINGNPIAASISVEITNGPAGGATSGTLHCHAFHD